MSWMQLRVLPRVDDVVPGNQKMYALDFHSTVPYCKLSIFPLHRLIYWTFTILRQFPAP